MVVYNVVLEAEGDFSFCRRCRANEVRFDLYYFAFHLLSTHAFFLLILRHTLLTSFRCDITVGTRRKARSKDFATRWKS